MLHDQLVGVAVHVHRTRALVPPCYACVCVCVCVYALGTRPRRAQLVAPVQSHGWMPALTQTRLHTHAHTSTDIRTHTRMRTCRPHPPNDADVALELLRVD